MVETSKQTIEMWLAFTWEVNASDIKGCSNKFGRMESSLYDGGLAKAIVDEYGR